MDRFADLHCPFEEAINPATALVHTETAAWAAGHGLAPLARAAQASEIFTWLVGRFYPAASKEKLRVISDWTTWLFWHDDLCDGTDVGRSPRKLERIFERYLVILDGTSGLRPGNPFEVALLDLRRRLASAAPSRAWYLRFLNTVQDYLAACVWEAENRARRAPLDVNLFIGMRRQASDMYSYVEFIDWLRGRCLPLAVRRHRDVVALVDCTNNVASWTNDLFSLTKELRDDDVHNLVVAIAAEQGVSLAAATATAVEYTNREMRRFVHTKARLRSFGPDLDEEVRDFVAALESLMRGNLDWSRETARYREAAPPPEVVFAARSGGAA
jgi:hypothetical protein